MNRRQWIYIAGISLIALALGVLTSQWIYRTGLASDPAIKAFFANPWKTAEGKTVNTDEWRGKVLVVNFWASWCPPCVEEMPTLDKLQQEFSSKNVLFVGIGIDSPSNIRQFLLKTPVNYPIVLGGLEGSNWAKNMGNPSSGLPFTVVIDSKGAINRVKLGKISEDELSSWLDSAILSPK